MTDHSTPDEHGWVPDEYRWHAQDTTIERIGRLARAAMHYFSLQQVFDTAIIDYPAYARGMVEFLERKNKAYGDSAAKPVRIFSQGGPHEALFVRMDDKLSRIVRGVEHDRTDETVLDTKRDLVGYLYLLAAVDRSRYEAWMRDASHPDIGDPLHQFPPMRYSTDLLGYVRGLIDGVLHDAYDTRIELSIRVLTLFSVEHALSVRKAEDDAARERGAM